MTIQYTLDQSEEVRNQGYKYGIGHIIATVESEEEVNEINVPVALTSYNFCVRVNLDSPPEFALNFAEVYAFSQGNYGGLSVDAFNLGDAINLTNSQSRLITIRRNDELPITEGVYDFPFAITTNETIESSAVWQQNWQLNFNGNIIFNQQPPQPQCSLVYSPTSLTNFTPTQFLSVVIPVGLGLTATFLGLGYGIKYLKGLGR